MVDKPGVVTTPATLLAGPELPESSAVAIRATRTNWAGNYTYSTACLENPATLAEVQRLVRATPHLKALGARHSFNGVADSSGMQVSLRHFDAIELDSSARLVKVGAGVTYGQLAPYIDKRGFAVHNLASLPHIGVVGACATATHGSGSGNGNLSTAVRAMELVTADGSLVSLSRETLGERFAGAVVALGALGVVTSITLAVEPSFEVAQTVYQNLPFSVLEHSLEAIFASGYSVSLFTDWQGSRATQVWIKQRLDHAYEPLPSEFHGAGLSTCKLHPLAGHEAENCTEQMGVPGPWYERLPHFKMNFVPSSGAEMQTEYFVPREKGYAAIRAIEELRDRIAPLLFVTEFRAIAADHLWMSPCYGRSTMALHFTWKPDWNAVRPLLPMIEARLAPFAVRPHWAKLFTLDPGKVRAQYARLADFVALAREYDPAGKFRNAFLETYVYES